MFRVWIPYILNTGAVQLPHAATPSLAHETSGSEKVIINLTCYMQMEMTQAQNDDDNKQSHSALHFEFVDVVCT